MGPEGFRQPHERELEHILPPGNDDINGVESIISLHIMDTSMTLTGKKLHQNDRCAFLHFVQHFSTSSSEEF